MKNFRLFALFALLAPFVAQAGSISGNVTTDGGVPIELIEVRLWEAGDKGWEISYIEIISFLVMGERKSVIFDTGMGISDISQVVKRLTDTELMVVNSHTHFDLRLRNSTTNVVTDTLVAACPEKKL